MKSVHEAMTAAWLYQVIYPIPFVFELRGGQSNSHEDPANTDEEINTPSTLSTLCVIARRTVLCKPGWY
jgi:hypothetical protein